MTNRKKIITRSGKEEYFQSGEIQKRIETLAFREPALRIDPWQVYIDTIKGYQDGMTTSSLDKFSASLAISLSAHHSDFGILAARIYADGYFKDKKRYAEMLGEKYTFAGVCRLLHDQKPVSRISEELFKISQDNADMIEQMIDYSRDSNISYLGLCMLENKNLLRVALPNQSTTDKRIKRISIECPQHMYMRIAIAIWKTEWSMVKRCYDMISGGFYSHATPTMYNAGTPYFQGASCFIFGPCDDSIDGELRCTELFKRMAKYAGGCGTPIQNKRSVGSYVKGTDGESTGVCSYIRELDAAALHINQGGKREGANAIYIEPWHPELIKFLQLREETGNELERARHLTYALWYPDEFLRQSTSGGEWYLIDPNDTIDDTGKGLYQYYDNKWRITPIKDEELFEGSDPEKPKPEALRDFAFTTRYRQLIRQGKGKLESTVEIWRAISHSLRQHGMPYQCMKDGFNRKSNQKNSGMIFSSNLCAEIAENTSDTETAVCNLASICLPKFVITQEDSAAPKNFAQKVNEKLLKETVAMAVRSIDRMIDAAYYPMKCTRTSNLKYRPQGIGVQGLADFFALMRVPFDGGKEAEELNFRLFEKIYFFALEESVELAREKGEAYETFAVSPLANGEFQFDLQLKELRDVNPDAQLPFPLSCDWDGLREKIKKYGVRNSLRIALMPTASTSYILGNSPCIEPVKSYIDKRRDSERETIIINPYLVNELEKRGIWSADQIIAAKGHLSNIESIPIEVRNLFKTAYEIDTKSMIDMMYARSWFVDQSYSFNWYMREPVTKNITSMVAYAWKKQLKTISYYVHSTPPLEAKAHHAEMMSFVTSEALPPLPPLPPRAASDNDDAVCQKGCDSCGA